MTRRLSWSGAGKEICNTIIHSVALCSIDFVSRQDLKALSTLLGSKDYMFGEKPSLLDASMFGFATCLMTLPEDSSSELSKYLQKELPNLVQHYERIKEKYWPDWEQMKHD